MRINLLSSFAAGIFLTSSICGAVYLFEKNEVSTPTVKTNETQTNEIQTNLNGQLSKNEMENNSASAGVTKVVFNVTQGMTSIDVGNMLEQSNMVPDAFTFSKDVEKKGLENNLHPGIFVVDSEMTYDQVISTIFKK